MPCSSTQSFWDICENHNSRLPAHGMHGRCQTPQLILPKPIPRPGTNHRKPWDAVVGTLQVVSKIRACIIAIIYNACSISVGFARVLVYIYSLCRSSKKHFIYTIYIVYCTYLHHFVDTAATTTAITTTIDDVTTVANVATVTNATNVTTVTNEATSKTNMTTTLLANGERLRETTTTLPFNHGI